MASSSSPSTPQGRSFGRWLRRLLVAGALLSVAALIVVALMPDAVPVDVVEVTRAPLVVTVDEDGRARVKNRHVVSAPLSGSLARIELRPGDEVQAGKIIARIVPLEAPLLDVRSRGQAEARVAAALAAQRQAKAQIERAEAALEFAQSNAARMEQVTERGAGTQLQLEQARLQARTAAAELESARFGATVADYEVRMARAILGRLSGKGGAAEEQFEVPAPVTGRVLKVMQESEGVVQAGSPLLEIADPSALEVAVDVLTRDAVRIAPGNRVALDRWGGPTLDGRVRLVEPSAFSRTSALGVEEQRVNVVIDLIDPRERWAALGDGYRIEAHIVVWENEDVLQVPPSSLFRQDGGWAVYRVRDGRAELVPVTLGERTSRAVEVTSGLDAGDEVVAHPSDRVQGGVTIAPRR
jgi:HlyD family secretion protein